MLLRNPYHWRFESRVYPPKGKLSLEEEMAGYIDIGRYVVRTKGGTQLFHVITLPVLEKI